MEWCNVYAQFKIILLSSEKIARGNHGLMNMPEICVEWSNSVIYPSQNSFTQFLDDRGNQSHMKYIYLNTEDQLAKNRTEYKFLSEAKLRMV